MRKVLVGVVSAAVCMTGCKPLIMQMNIPEGPPEYVQGFKDGCDSGVNTGGELVMKLFHPYRKDPEKLDNALYKMGWNEGFSYCRFYQTPKP